MLFSWCYVATERQPERRLQSQGAARLSDDRHELLESRAMTGHEVVRGHSDASWIDDEQVEKGRKSPYISQ